MSRLAVLWVVMLAACSDLATASSQCEQITIRLCQYDAQDLRYNRTRMPNMLGHQTQDEAGLEVHQFFPLVRVGCSGALKTLLCALYAPQCRAESADPVPPCRELCDDARSGCWPLMAKFGFLWPDFLNCSRFPSAESGAVCVGAGGEVSLPEPPATSPAAQTRPPPAGTPAGPQAATCCPCGSETAALRERLEDFISATESLQQRQADTLDLQQANLRLEKRKLELEIRVLERQLRRN